MSKCHTPGHVPVENEFVATTSPADQYNDVELGVRFHGFDDRTITAPAFWTGGASWKVRFAPPESDQWRYRTACHRADEGRLDRRCGVARAAPFTGDHPLLAPDWLQVSVNRQRLEHASGLPLHWIGDMWWKGLSRRLNWPDGLKQRATGSPARLHMSYMPEPWDVPKALNIEPESQYVASGFDPMTDVRHAIGHVTPDVDDSWADSRPVVAPDGLLVMEAAAS